MIIFHSIFQSFCIEIGLLSLIFGLLILDLFKKEKHKNNLGYFSIIFLILILIIQFLNGSGEEHFFYNSFVQDPLSFFFKTFFLLTALFIVLMSREYVQKLERGQNEFYILILLATLGMCIIASAKDFLILFVSLELITVSLYIMTAYSRTDSKSIEAGLKYLILGALSAGFLLYGISFLYGTTGSIHFDVISQKLSREHLFIKGALLGFLLIMAGVGFKIASVPFQFWVPDVYEGAPTPISAFLSVGSKATGFLILIRLIWSVFPNFKSEIILLMSFTSALTLLYGNLAAIPQKNIKRFLGYSSIGHAGYLLMGIAAYSSSGLVAVLYYLSAYLFANLAAFTVVVIFYNSTSSNEIADYSGLSKRSPFLAACMLLALMSLAGIPPLAGFFGKFLLISAAVKSNLVWLAFLGAINIIISLYYYLVIIKKMYIEEPSSDQSIFLPLLMRIGLIILIMGIIVLGIFQEPVLDFATRAIHSFTI